MSQGGTTTHRPRPKVVYLCLDPGISLVPRPGAAVHAVSMIEAMQGLGLEVVPVGAAELLRNGRRRGALAALPRGQRYVDVLRRLLVERPAVSERLRRLLAAHAPDLVYERTSQLYDVGGEAACAASVPLVLEVNAPLAWEGARFRDERLGALAARQERRAWRLARRVTAVSQDLAGRVSAAGQRDVVHVPNAVDHSRFHPGVAPDPGLAARTAGTFTVAFAGTVKPWHDLPTLLEAMHVLGRTLRCTLVIVGDGPDRAALERGAAELGVPLVVTGAVDHARVPELLAVADACVAPMHPDPLLHYFSPLKAVEYLALGRPTVVADAGELSDLVAAGAATGYRPGSADELAAAMLRLATDRPLAEATSARGLALAAQRSWRSAAERSLRGLVPVPDPVPA